MSNSTLTPDEVKRKQVLEALAKIPTDDRLEFLYSLTADSMCESCGRILEFDIEPITDCQDCGDC